MTKRHRESWLVRTRAVARVTLVAGFFVLLAFEFASPHLCREKFATMSSGGGVAVIVGVADNSASEPADPPVLARSESPGHEVPIDDCEDCLCCCSHVVVAFGSSPIDAPIDATLSPPNPLAFPTSPPSATFRPPRAI